MYTERTVDGMGKYCTKEATTSCRGFTLMELMVYIAIVGIVVIVAGQAFSNSTKMRVRTQSMLKASEVAENVAALFKQDVAQTGAKSSMEAGTTEAGNNFDAVHTSVYMDPTPGSCSSADYSSFRISASSNQSDLTIRRIRYDANGYFQATEEVRWYVEGDKLKRSCKLVEKKSGLTITDDDPCADVNGTPKEAEMAEGIASFAVEAAEPGVLEANEQVFPAADAAGKFDLYPRTGDMKYVGLTVDNPHGLSVTLSDFFSNYDIEKQQVIEETSRKVNQVFARKNETITGTAPVWSSICQKITLSEGREYELSFVVEPPGGSTESANRSLSFVPGVDHMSVGFRSTETGDFPRKNGAKILDDFLFFPPLDATKGGGKRSMRFTVSETLSDVCLAFTFACFSPLVYQGRVSISNLKLKQVASTSYVFNDGGYATEAHKVEKKNIKALRLKLKISRNGEGGNTEVIVPIPSNGPSD